MVHFILYFSYQIRLPRRITYQKIFAVNQFPAKPNWFASVGNNAAKQIVLDSLMSSEECVQLFPILLILHTNGLVKKIPRFRGTVVTSKAL
jgi:hypothetical protein